MKNRSYAAHRKLTGVIIVILSVLLAVLIPVCAYLARDYFVQEEDPNPVTAPVSENRIATSPLADSGSADEPGPASSEPEAASGGPVPESEPVAQDYFDDAIFFGDSLTAGINVYKLMSNAQVIAATGINPSTVLTKAIISVPGTEERITMMDALRVARPGKIYIQLGANWVGERSGIDEKTFVEHYRALIEKIREDHPETIVYIQSMFPVSRAYDTNENGKNTYGLTNELIRTYNGALEALSKEMNVWYLDIYNELCNDDGYLPEDKTSDGMHLVPEYYQIWFDYLKYHAVAASPADGEETSVSGSEEAGSVSEASEPEASELDSQIESQEASGMLQAREDEALESQNS